MNIINCLVEGYHDAAFLQEILKYNGFKIFNNKVKDLPDPISNLYTNPRNIYDSDIEDLTHHLAHKRINPYTIMQLDDNLIIIFSTLGLDSKELREKIIQSITDLRSVETEEGELDLVEGHDLNFLYIWDSDDVGVKDRLNQIRIEISQLFNGPELEEIENGQIVNINRINFGAFVVTGKDNQYGKLEDILVPLMEAENQDIFDKARNYLSIHEETALFKGKVKYKDENKQIIKTVNKRKYDSKKSLIGTVGQLQKSGMANTVCITQTDFLNEDKIKSNDSCQEIFDFVTKVM